ncbi:hypothetical protein IQ265_06055 [Nodosilinea sp. LEGE 06152]|uniref:hypothetical protein n=1 Tax=Nodosilinea sp. LEGE 06152 TaxID=2777966 RepID=UPI0018828372|nr:hypothetical protein [Nodosilinea sp. LEGE 06152]MBE9156392.1 hypothetical protein [Nodosilinea sp. LEGE 06152]
MKQSFEYPVLLQSLLNRQQTLNKFATQLDNSIQLFGLASIPLSQDSLWECQFQRLVSWLYVLYWEFGKKADIQFLIDLFQAYGLDPDGLCREHPKLVRALRTIAQHSVVSHNSEPDRRTHQVCQKWFDSTCRLLAPSEDKDWQICLLQLVNEAEKFFDALHQCLLFIKDDESCNEMLEQWKLRREKRLSPWDYDALIRELMSDLGIEGQKQVTTIRKRYQSQWDRYLQSLTNSDDFKENVKRCILDTLLDKTEILMPLGTDDIIQVFHVEAGDREIGKLLGLARNLFRNNSYLTKDELLNELKKNKIKDKG